MVLALKTRKITQTVKPYQPCYSPLGQNIIWEKLIINKTFLKKKIAILCIFCVVALAMFAQKLQQACVNKTAMQYYVNGPAGMLFHWKLEGGTFATPDTLNDTIYINWDKPGQHQLKVYGEYNGCFTDYFDLQINLRASPVVTLGPDQEICQNEHFIFELDTSYKTIVWHDKTLGRTYIADTTEDVWVKVTDRFGCNNYDTVKVTVNALPIVNLGKDTSLCGSDQLVLNATNEGAIYRWNVLDPKTGSDYNTPKISVGKGEKYYAVEVTDINGCVAKDTIHVSKCLVQFDKDKLPTAFTPNGDKKNDYWQLNGLTEDYPDAIVEVYTRGGIVVFRSEKGFPKPWDGRNQNSGEALPMDNYFYIINLNDKEGNKVAGRIFLVR
jgi:gliding motility-associated-like protein